MSATGGVLHEGSGPGALGQSAPARRAPWYRRRGVLLAAGIAAIVAVTVVSDLPQHQSRTVQVSAALGVLKEVNADVGPCAYALHEAVLISGDLRSGQLTASQRGQVPGLLRDDQAACSFTDDSIYQLSTIEVPGTAAGKTLGALVNTVTLWATSDALAAIEQIQAQSTHRPGTAQPARLRPIEVQLARDNAEASSQLTAAGTELHTTLPALALTAVKVASRS